jgi:hypothetical protein
MVLRVGNAARRRENSGLQPKRDGDDNRRTDAASARLGRGGNSDFKRPRRLNSLLSEIFKDCRRDEVAIGFVQFHDAYSLSEGFGCG